MRISLRCGWRCTVTVICRLGRRGAGGVMRISACCSSSVGSGTVFYTDALGDRNCWRDGRCRCIVGCAMRISGRVGRRLVSGGRVRIGRMRFCPLRSGRRLLA